MEAVRVSPGGTEDGGGGGEGFFDGGGVSGFGGLIPFIFSSPSMVTVFPSGDLSAFSSFFFPISGRLEQEAHRKERDVRKIKVQKSLLRSRLMNTPFA
jgi:hypothetical protein